MLRNVNGNLGVSLISNIILPILFNQQALAVALRQIKRYQKGFDLMIPKLFFSRVVREIAVTHMDGVRFSKPVIEAMHKSAEAFLCHIFEDVNICAIHVKRITLMTTDIQL